MKNYMVENKLSNGKMAKKMGVGTSTVGNVLASVYEPGMDFVKKVSSVTGLSIVQLFSPDPKQFGGAVEGDVQDGNAVAMMELMKKQMIELKEENEAILKHRNMVTDHNVGLRQENTKLREENEDLVIRLAEYEKEYTALAQENLRLVSEGYHGKNEPAEVDNLTLHVNTIESGRDYMYADLGRISVDEVVSVSPLDKKVTLTLYFDEIHIK